MGSRTRPRRERRGGHGSRSTAGRPLGSDREVEVANSRGAPPGSIAHDVDDVRLGHDPAPPGPQRGPQHGDRIALGLDGAAVEGAEAAVVARRSAVVLDAVDAGRCPVRMEARPLGRRHGQRRQEHVGPGRHGVGARPWRGERVPPGTVGAGDADQPLRLGVERLEVVVGDGPVDDVGPVDRAVLGEEREVVLPEAGELAVGVDAAAADRRRQVVHVADEDAVAVRLVPSERAGLEPRVGTEEVALGELELVVGEVTERLERRVEREQVVAALLEHDHRPSRGGEHMGGGRPAGTAADDDGVAVGAVDRRRDRHRPRSPSGSLTSVSVYPRGWTSPSNPMARHPLRSRLPP